MKPDSEKTASTHPLAALKYPLLLAFLALVGWAIYQGASVQEIDLFGFKVKFGQKTDTPLAAMRIYHMDRNPARIIVVTHEQGKTYRIEEASSPWPWQGTARIDGGQLIGKADFKKTRASMQVKGVIRGDGSIVIEYDFVTNDKGLPHIPPRVDEHIWYPAP